MRTFEKKYYGGLPLEKNVYEVDFAVVDRYQMFSTELLRVSLLGITGYGFLISEVFLKTSAPSPAMPTTALILVAVVLVLGVASLAAAATYALAHRFYSTDCTAHFVRRVRAEKRTGEPCSNEERDAALEIALEEERSLSKDINRCYPRIFLT